MSPLAWKLLAAISLVGLFYIYAGYPLLCALLARLRPRPARRGGGDLPDCSVLIVACNEAAVLPGKIRSILDGAHADRVREIVVVSDGSTDRTAEVLAALGDPRVRVEERTARAGKPTAFNEWIPRCVAPVVVLTDARQHWSPDALGLLLANFADPSVGVVSGELEFRAGSAGTTAAQGIDAYWRYEKFIRRQEAAFGSVPGATGALNAIRREAFRPIHPDTVLDDVAVPLGIVRQGYRCLFEPGAIAYDTPHQEAGKESVRKRRTIGGNLQLVLHDPSLLLPWRNPLWFAFVSHKLSRLLSPWLMLLLAAAAWALRGAAGWGGLLFPLAGVFLALVAAGWVLQKAGRRSRLLGIPLMFFALNVSTLLAWYDVFAGRLHAVWDRSDKRGG